MTDYHLDNPKTRLHRSRKRQESTKHRTHAACPVRISARRVSRMSSDLRLAIRRLRRDLNACRHCDRADDCPLLAALHAQVDQAIAEVLEEWEAQA